MTPEMTIRAVRRENAKSCSNAVPGGGGRHVQKNVKRVFRQTQYTKCCCVRTSRARYFCVGNVLD